MHLGIPIYCSVSEMFAYTNIRSRQRVIRCKCNIIHSFIKRVENTTDDIVQVLCSDGMYIYAMAEVDEAAVYFPVM